MSVQSQRLTPEERHREKIREMLLSEFWEVLQHEIQIIKEEANNDLRSVPLDKVERVRGKLDIIDRLLNLPTSVQSDIVVRKLNEEEEK